MADARVYIDNADILTTYGVTMVSGLSELMAYPSVKGGVRTLFPEGTLKVDRGALALETRTATLKFIARHGSGIMTFINALHSALTHTIAVKVGNDTVFSMNAILDENTAIGSVGNVPVQAAVKIYLNEDFLTGYVYSAPSMNAADYGYCFSGITEEQRFYKYGVVPLDGCDDELRRTRKVLRPLEVKSSHISGSTIDAGAGVIADISTVKLPLYCRCEGNVENYRGFLHSLMKTTHIYVQRMGVLLPVVQYRSASVQTAMFENGVLHIVFSITVEVQ